MAWHSQQIPTYVVLLWYRANAKNPGILSETKFVLKGKVYAMVVHSALWWEKTVWGWKLCDYNSKEI